jgi:hypothetical protein
MWGHFSKLIFSISLLISISHYAFGDFMDSLDAESRRIMQEGPSSSDQVLENELKKMTRTYDAVIKNIKTSIKLTDRDSRELGIKEGQLGEVLYLRGKTLLGFRTRNAKYEDQAKEDLKKADDLGNSRAELSLAQLYLGRKQNKKNFKKGMEYLDGAARRGDVEALSLAGKLYENGVEGLLPANEMKAKQAYLGAFERGEASPYLLYIHKNQAAKNPHSTLSEAARFSKEDLTQMFLIKSSAEHAITRVVTPEHCLGELSPFQDVNLSSEPRLDKRTCGEDQVDFYPYYLDAMKRQSSWAKSQKQGNLAGSPERRGLKQNHDSQVDMLTYLMEQYNQGEGEKCYRKDTFQALLNSSRLLREDGVEMSPLVLFHIIEKISVAQVAAGLARPNNPIEDVESEFQDQHGLTRIRTEYHADGSTYIFYREKVLGEGGFKLITSAYELKADGLHPIAVGIPRPQVAENEQQRRQNEDKMREDMQHEEYSIQFIDGHVRNRRGLIEQKMLTNAQGRRVIVSPQYQGDMLSAVKDMTESEKISAFEELTHGVLNLHRSGMYHGDLKLQNTLVKGYGKDTIVGNKSAVIADFGLSVDVADEIHRRAYVSYRGTPGFIAPEGDTFVTPVMSQEKAIQDILKKDVFSLGVMMAQSSGNRTVLEKSHECLERYQYTPAYFSCFKEKITTLHRSLYRENNRGGPDSMLKLWIDCINPDVDARPTSEEVWRRVDNLKRTGNGLPPLPPRPPRRIPSAAVIGE